MQPSADAERTPDEQEVIELVQALRETGNLRPLIAMLRATDEGPERARDALRTLGEFNLDLLVQISLDTLIDDYVDDPALALQIRRVIHKQPDAP